MKKIKIENYEYELIKNKDNCFNEEDFNEKITDYFYDYDYIFGDYAYDKLRLKGFNNSDNKNFRPINDIKNLDLYTKEYCAYGAKCFLLQKSTK